MDDAKKISEDATKSTAEFMKLFTSKYTSSTVSNTLKGHIKTTLQNSYQNASKNEEKEKDTTDAEKEQQKSANEQPKPETDTKDDEKDKVTDETEPKKEEMSPKESDTKESETKETQPETESKQEQTTEPSKEEPNTESKTEPSNDDDSKEEKERVILFEYKASYHSGVYGSYALTDVPITEPERIAFPIIGVAVNGYKKQLIDGGGNEYNAFNILYYKLSINDSNPSRFGTKLCRYSRLRDYHERMSKKSKKNTKNLKFPSKSLAFWKKNDDAFLENRQKELNKYFVQSTGNAYISGNDTFQIFLGLKQDSKRVQKMKVFNAALLHTCNEMKYDRLPNNSELNRFDTEQNMILYSVMIDIKHKTADDIKEIVAKQPEKFRSALTTKINKSLAVSVQKCVNTSWTEIECLNAKINTELSDILENKTDTFDGAIAGLMDKVRPIIEGKLKPKPKGVYPNISDEKEQKCEDLCVRDIQSLQQFLESISDGKGLNKLCNAYLDTFVVLSDRGKREQISKYLWDTFQFVYGEYVKGILTAYAKYESEGQLICAGMSGVIQSLFGLVSQNLLLIFEGMDNEGVRDRKGMLELCEKMSERMANGMGELYAEIGNELRSIDSNALQIIVGEISVLSGFVGNVLCSVVSDYYNGNGSEAWDLKQSLEGILEKYLGMFCESVLNVLCASVSVCLLREVKGEIKGEIDALFGEDKKLEFDFIPDSLGKSVPKDILESVIDVMISYLLQKNMKKKRKILDAKLFQTIQSN